MTPELMVRGLAAVLWRGRGIIVTHRLGSTHL